MKLELPASANEVLTPQRRSGRTYRMLAYALDLAIGGIHVDVQCRNEKTMRLALLKVAADRFPNRQHIETLGVISFTAVPEYDQAHIEKVKNSSFFVIDHQIYGED